MKRIATALLSGVLMAGIAVTASSADLKIGVVQLQRLLQEAPQAKAAAAAIQSELAPRQRDFQNQQASLKAREEKLQKDAATMSDTQRSSAEKELRDAYRDLTRKKSEIEDDIGARDKEESERLNRILVEETQVYAKAQNFDLVLFTGVLFASPALDITSQVLAALTARAAKGPAAAAPAAAPKPAAPAPAK